MTFDWAIEAKDWVFSGIGTVLIVSGSSYLWKSFRRRSVKSSKKRNVDPEAYKTITLDNLYFKYSNVASQALIALNTNKCAIDELIHSQYSSHPLLISLNYQSLPVPLKSGLHAIITKQLADCLIEDVRTTITEGSVLAAWTKLRNAYFVAYNLDFRHDHTLLIKRSELRKTNNIMQELFIAAQEYYAVRSAFLNTDERGKLHDLKNSCASAMLSLQCIEEYENLDGIIGKLAINVEMAISAIHKILLDRRIGGSD